jgi:hypothetical protein
MKDVDEPYATDERVEVASGEIGGPPQYVIDAAQKVAEAMVAWVGVMRQSMLEALKER